MGMVILKPVLIMLGISAVIYLVIAFGLILSQPVRPLEPRAGLDFASVLGGASKDAHQSLTRTSYTTPDGTTHPLIVADGPGPDAPLVVMVHGSGWHGGQFEGLAAALRDVAEVKAVTLRGHGLDPERRGDLDYIGQFEDDLAALIAPARAAGRKVMLLGHSSGGGLVVRFAGGLHGGLIDRAVLLAPFLKHNAPTTRAKSGGWAEPLTRRLIGLSMLNAARLRMLNRLTVIQFHMPQEVLDGPFGGYATTAYSYRLNTSYAPRSDYLTDVAALPPFLLVAGLEDEAFHASEYEPLMGSVTGNGRYVLVPETGHLDIVDAPETEAAIREVLRELE